MDASRREIKICETCGRNFLREVGSQVNGCCAAHQVAPARAAQSNPVLQFPNRRTLTQIAFQNARHELLAARGLLQRRLAAEFRSEVGISPECLHLADDISRVDALLTGSR